MFYSIDNKIFKINNIFFNQEKELFYSILFYSILINVNFIMFRFVIQFTKFYSVSDLEE